MQTLIKYIDENPFIKIFIQESIHIVVCNPFEPKYHIFFIIKDDKFISWDEYILNIGTGKIN